jgi:hypothetical protein
VLAKQDNDYLLAFANRHQMDIWLGIREKDVSLANISILIP